MALSTTYKDFFKRTINERHVFLQGGRRSGKTWASFQWLAAIGGIQGGTRVVVLCYQLPQLRATMADFTAIFGIVPTGSDIMGYNAVTKGVRWLFVHCDDKTKAQGTMGDYLFVNEAVNFPSEKGIIETYAMGIREQIFYNYNPTKSWSYAEKRKNGNNTLCTTWKDNAENLTKDQIAEFEAIKERAQRPNASRFDEYNYQVYYLGNFATMVGAIFTSISSCTFDDYKQIPAEEVLGMDFGFATNGDPTTLIGVKYFNHLIYIHQYIYERGLTSDEELGHRLIANGINYKTMIFGDYGGMGRGRMNTLITADNGKWGTAERPGTEDIAKGFTICDAMKSKTILDGLSQMLSTDGIVITTASVETKAEFENYELDENGRTKGADHAIDASRYAFTYLKAAS